jgi:uncharacterized BrkB/YihY/UPF0761 family membrane protein
LNFEAVCLKKDMRKKLFACAVIALMAAVSYELSFSLQYARAFGATGCMRLGEGAAIQYTAFLMLAIGTACAAVCSLIPRFNKHARRVIVGSLVAVFTFLVGLFSLALLLKVIG